MFPPTRRTVPEVLMLGRIRLLIGGFGRRRRARSLGRPPGFRGGPAVLPTPPTIDLPIRLRQRRREFVPDRRQVRRVREISCQRLVGDSHAIGAEPDPGRLRVRRAKVGATVFLAKCVSCFHQPGWERCRWLNSGSRPKAAAGKQRTTQTENPKTFSSISARGRI